MSTEPSSAPVYYNDQEVMEPQWRMERFALEGGEESRQLYLQTFFQPDAEALPGYWESTPEANWHLLVELYTDRIVTYPIFTNPHSLHYLNAKHGRFLKVVYVDDSGEALPTTLEEAERQFNQRMDGTLDIEYRYGLGLAKDLIPLWQHLHYLREVETLVITRDGDPRIEGDSVYITARDLAAYQRCFEKIDRASRAARKDQKAYIVRNELLSALAPDRFPRIEQVKANRDLVEYRRVARRPSKQEVKEQSRAAVKEMRDQLPRIAAEAGPELVRLHAEIERVTLAQMIEQFEAMLQRSLSEHQWQRFFEANTFILSMAFARPVRLLSAHFHARGSQIDGAGAHIGDFLFAERGQGLAIVEIKKPGTDLLYGTPYRNEEVFAPSKELSGAITQVLYQQSELHLNWYGHSANSPSLAGLRPDTIRCVVIAGRTPTDSKQLRSLEVFRNACKNVDVLTYDELLAKLRLLFEHLNPNI